ncbi:MAG: hypothetical protein LUG99_17265 [Lachnospiraceae bacterium]|nr:hypothetical protein [Lachnospiraceae bacterium]
MKKKKHNYICDIIKALWAALGIMVFTGLSIACMVNCRYLFALVYAALDALYLFLIVRNLSIISIDEEKVEKRMMGKTVLSVRWDEIKDVGLINRKFIYFSKEEMTDDDRYFMCYEWPPKDKIYFRAGKGAVELVELLWNRREQLFVRYRSERFR